MTSREKTTVITSIIASLTSIALAVVAIFNSQSRLETIKGNPENTKIGITKETTIDLETAKFAYELIRPTVNMISDDVHILKLEVSDIKGKRSGGSEEEIEQGNITPVDCGVPEQSASDAGMTTITPTIIPQPEPAPPAPTIPPEYMQQQFFVPKLPPFEEFRF